MQWHRSQHAGSPRGCFGRANGVMIVIASLGVAAVGWIALNNLAEALRQSPQAEKDLPELALTIIQRRSWLFALVLPAVVIGLLASLRRRSGWLSTALLLLADLWIVALFLMIVYTFIMFMVPLYQYRPI